MVFCNLLLFFHLDLVGQNLKSLASICKIPFGSNTTFYASSAHTIDLTDSLVLGQGNCNRLLPTN